MAFAFSFFVDGLEITEADVWGLSVNLDLKEGAATLRTQSGNLVKQVAWTKYSVKIQCEGHYLPAALNSLDYSAAMEFISPQGITETKPAATSITTDRSFRQDGDYQPIVYSILTDGSKEIRASTITSATTLDTAYTAGVDTVYIVLYFPILQVFFNPPDQNWDQYSAKSEWTLSGEEA